MNRILILYEIVYIVHMMYIFIIIGHSYSLINRLHSFHFNNIICTYIIHIYMYIENFNFVAFEVSLKKLLLSIVF